MLEFSPGEVRTAIASMSNPTAKAFSYNAELYLGLPKTASSGVISFSLAAGETRNISFPVIMPDAEGTYPVYLDVFVASQLIGAYRAVEDVVIRAPIVPVLGGQILYSKWRETGTEEWRSWPLPVPGDTPIDVLWHIRNDSNCRASFVTNTGTLDPLRFFTIHSDASVTLDPGEEADLVHIGYQGEKSGTSGTQTWHLAVQAGEVISTYGPDWYYTAKIVDSVTLKFSWY